MLDLPSASSGSQQGKTGVHAERPQGVFDTQLSPQEAATSPEALTLEGMRGKCL